jgi:predicted ATPase
VGAAIELRPGFVLGGFRIDSSIGRGGMGVVYRATQLSLERPVALKLISPELASEERFRERFLREGRLAASLDHPHLLPVYEAGEAEGTLFLAMRLVEGASLAELLRREGRLAPELSLRLLSQLGQALEAAHAAGLLHRDVKPQNVLVAGSGEREHAYLCDFGLARRLSGGSLTQERAFLGTALYAAPEQIRGEELDGRADLYALACLFYECLAGEPPFPAEDELAVCWAHLHEPPPAPSVIDPALARFDPFFSRALAKDPGERYPSASALVEAALAALASEAAPKTLHQMNLPVQPTPIVGREREVAELKALLCSEEVRLLTLTGPGGTGKTRLALELASELVDHFPSGVFFVGLAPITEPGLVFPTIAQTVGLREQPGQSVAETLRDYVRDRDLLLVLDNLERLLPVVPEIASLLAESRRLKLLVTSRSVLRLAAEHVFSVPPLQEGAALSLFAARARAARPDFVVDGSREAVQEICRRLDGLPLTIELAAVRVRALPPEQILSRLDQRLKLLTGGARDLPERQQTLRAAISWSYDLLSAEEQVLFRRLAVFAGGWSLEAAEAVVDAHVQLSLDVLDGLGSLIDQSLVRPGRHIAGEPRFWMLETIREYALERLHESGEAEAVRRRHLEWAVALAEQSETEVRGSRARVVLERLEAEHDNFLAALTPPLDQEGAELRLRLLSALSEFWRDRGHVAEARRLLDEELKSSAIAPEIKAKALYAAGVLANAQSHYGEAKAFLHDSIDLFQEHGDELGRALSLCELSFSSTMAGDHARASSFAEDALELARGIGEAWLVCEALSFASLALIEEERNFERMEQLLGECVELSRTAGYKQRLAHALNDLGCVALMRKDPERASGLLTESLAIDDELGLNYYRTFALGSLGWARIDQKDAGRAAVLFAEQLALSQRLGAKWNAGEALQGLAALAAGERRFARAACLFAAGQSLQASTGSAPGWQERGAWEQHEPEIRAHLNRDEFNAAWVAGQQMTFDEATGYGLSGESEPALSS